MKMSDDDFFTDKESTLQYIHSRSSTKIDDILKRRQWRKLKEGTEPKSDSYLSANENWNWNETENRKSTVWGDNPNENSSIPTIDKRYEKNEPTKECDFNGNEHGTGSSLKQFETENIIYLNKTNSTILRDMNEKHIEKSHGSSINHAGRKGGMTGYDVSYNENKIDKKYVSNGEAIKEIEQFIASRKGNLQKSENENDTRNTTPHAKLKSNLTSYNSVVSDNNELRSMSRKNSSIHMKERYSSFLIDPESEPNIEYTDSRENANDLERETSLLLKRRMDIFKTPSTEILLDKMKSVEEDEKQDEPFINLNKLSISNEIDMNRTPTKSYTQSYSKSCAEYLKFETAGKMNMSELETPHYMKEEEHGNTPFISLYLAGKRQETYTENDAGSEDVNKITPNTVTKNEGLPNDLEENEVYNYSSISEKETNVGKLRTMGHATIEIAKRYSKEIKETNELKELNENKKIRTSSVEKVKDKPIEEYGIEANAIYETASSTSNKTNNKYYDVDIYNKINSSKKYNFLKTEEQYDEIMKKKSKVGSAISYENKIGTVGVDNKMSFADKQYSISPFNIMSSKAFKMNYLGDLKTNNYESKMNFSNYRADSSNNFARRNTRSMEIVKEPSSAQIGHRQIYHIQPSCAHIRSPQISRTFSCETNALINRNVEREKDHVVATAPEIYSTHASEISQNILPSIFASKKDEEKNRSRIMSLSSQRNSFDKRYENESDSHKLNNYDNKYGNENIFIGRKRSASVSENPRVSEKETKDNRESPFRQITKQNSLLHLSEEKEDINIVPLNKQKEYIEEDANYHTLDTVETKKSLSKQDFNNVSNTSKMIYERKGSNEMSPEYKKFLSYIQETYVDTDKKKTFQNKNDSTKHSLETGTDAEKKKQKEMDTDTDTDTEAEKEKEKETETEKEKINNSFVNYKISKSRNKGSINREQSKKWKSECEEREECDESIKEEEREENEYKKMNKNNNNNNNYNNNNVQFKGFHNKSAVSKPKNSASIGNCLCETADFGRKEIINQYDESSSKYSEDMGEVDGEKEKTLLHKSHENKWEHKKENSVDCEKITEIIRDISKNNKSNNESSYNISGNISDIPWDAIQKEINTNNDINEYIKEQIRNGVSTIIQKIMLEKGTETAAATATATATTYKHNPSRKEKKGKETKKEIRRSGSEEDTYEIKTYSDNAENELNGYISKGKKRKEALVRSHNHSSNNCKEEMVSSESLSVKTMRKIYEKNYSSEGSDISNNSSRKQNDQKKKKKRATYQQRKTRLQHEFDLEDLKEINTLNEKLKMNKINKHIEIRKEDIEKQNINVKNVLYSCIDVIYHLLNEHMKKNNKLKDLINEIENINEYEKKIQKLTDENEHLKKEIQLKNEQFQKKELKEKALLNKKIAEQTNKISAYEKDIAIYKNKINNLNNRKGNDEKKAEKLQAQYQKILEEVETCKTKANTVVKHILNKKNINFVEKQCLDIAEYYEIQMNSLNKEIKNIKEIMQKDMKEKIRLVKRLNELEEKKIEKGSEDIELEKEKTIANEKETTNRTEEILFFDKESKSTEIEKMKKKKETETKAEETYKIKYQNLFKELKKMKKDLIEQKKQYDKKISRLEEAQEMQNRKSEQNAAEKIVHLYNSMFKEKVNNVTNDDGALGFVPNKEQTKNDVSFYQQNTSPQELFSKANPFFRYESNKSITDYINDVEAKERAHSKNYNMENMFLESVPMDTYGAQDNTQNSSFQNSVAQNSLFDIHPSMNKSGKLFASKRHLANSPWNDYGSYVNNLMDISRSINSNKLKNYNNINHEQYFNNFVKLYIECSKINSSNRPPFDKEFYAFQKSMEHMESSKFFFQCNSFQNDVLHKNLLNYEKEKLIEIITNICNDLKTCDIFIIVQFVKFLSFIVYEHFPLFISFYYSIASLVSMKSIQFQECIEIIKKWKMYYVHGKKLYCFRKNVLLIFKSNLQHVKKKMIDEECVNLIKAIYDKNSEVDKSSKDFCDKDEDTINTDAKELNRIIKTYMDIYNIQEISSIIAHMNFMNHKFKTQSYFVHSISSCLKLNKTDNLQEIEEKVKDLASLKEIKDKLKNKINIEDIDEYWASYTILNKLKRYLNISQTKDLLPSLLKIIQNDSSSAL